MVPLSPITVFPGINLRKFGLGVFSDLMKSDRSDKLVKLLKLVNALFERPIILINYYCKIKLINYKSKLVIKNINHL